MNRIPVTQVMIAPPTVDSALDRMATGQGSPPSSEDGADHMVVDVESRFLCLRREFLLH